MTRGGEDEKKRPIDEQHFVLTRRALRFMDLPPRRTSVPGLPGLIQGVGIMGLCITANLEKLSAAEFAKRFPKLCPRRGHQVGAYALTEDKRIARLIIDHGTASSFSICRKVQKVIAKHYSIEGFREKMLTKEFVVIVAVATRQKASPRSRRNTAPIILLTFLSLFSSL